MRRLKCEKETIILTNEDDGFYDVYTFNQSLQKRLRSFAEKYPEDCWLKGASEDGSETYMIRIERVYNEDTGWFETREVELNSYSFTDDDKDKKKYKPRRR